MSVDFNKVLNSR